ncbi:MAG: DUF4338 domain-containing protein [Limnochordales bacterium]|nr:DUF4338 domain-containing protein [Limnochordales bacterium]
MTTQELAARVWDFYRHFAAGAASGDKEGRRRLFLPARQYVLEKNRTFLERHSERLLEHIASGFEVEPERMSPVVIPVATERDSMLFRFASLSWSVPVSSGYGRRLRFLVLDQHNEKLIGILGLCDPVFNLACRDRWIGWEVRQKEERLRSVMNAYVLGAVPPYSFLLGGKLVALLALSNEVRAEFRRRYRGQESVIKGRPHDGVLALITVTSALGRSSLYNRLKARGRTYYFRLGETAGWGHHHLSYNGLWEGLHALLEEAEDPLLKKHRYGCGPNWKFRLVRRALELLGLPEDVLRHELKREVYAAPLGDNALAFLRGEADRLEEYDWPTEHLFWIFRERWLLSRARRTDAWRRFRREEFLGLVGLQGVRSERNECF